MNKNKVRHALAIGIVIFSLLLIAFLIIFPFVTSLYGLTENEEITSKYFDKAAAFFSGLVGTVIGYYFGSKSIE